jgi:hypothetical protein
MIHSLHGTNVENTIFPLNPSWTELLHFNSFYDNGIQDGRDIQAVLTDRIICQRHVGGFLAYPVWCLVQSAISSLLSNVFCDLRTQVGLILIS